MNERDDGGPVFPCEIHTVTPDTMDPETGEVLAFRESTETSAGMSLRDWFAGQALIAIADDCGMSDEEIATCCYERADAMIARRFK